MSEITRSTNNTTATGFNEDPLDTDESFATAAYPHPLPQILAAILIYPPRTLVFRLTSSRNGHTITMLFPMSFIWFYKHSFLGIR